MSEKEQHWKNTDGEMPVPVHFVHHKVHMGVSSDLRLKKQAADCLSCDKGCYSDLPAFIFNNLPEHFLRNVKPVTEI
jgi:hypothetical protein